MAFNFQNDILVTTLSQTLLSANSTKVTSNGSKMLQDFTPRGPLSRLYSRPAFGPR